MGVFVVAPAATFHHPHFPGQYPPAAFLGFDGPCPATAALGVIPLLPDESVVGGCGRGGGLQLWQSGTAPAAAGYYSACAGGASDAAAVGMEDAGGRARVDSQNLLPLQGGDSAAAAAAATCRDCGNQAKKDCVHRRCRTCCKNRGLDCSTHVKSTWVPAARRRESHRFSTSAVTASRSQSASSGAKKPRLLPGNHSQTSHASTSKNTAAAATTGGSMPKQVMAHAEFRFVRVSPVDGGGDEYGYQAVVRIGGRVFKGFLYDQGLDVEDGDYAGKGIYGSGPFPKVSSPPPIAVPPSSESHDIYGGATTGIGMGGSNVGTGNPFQ